jgi:hypothetical protein
MRKKWIGVTLAPALALLAGPLWAQQRAPTTVVACSGPFAKDSSHLKLAMFFDSKNITFTDVEASGGSAMRHQSSLAGWVQATIGLCALES